VIDLGQGWRTQRLDLEPLAVAHAAELAPLLDDPRLHEFTGGAPVGAAALADRYRRLEKRRSSGGDQGWGNWVMRVRASGRAVGTVQATLPVGGPAAGPAEVAWVLAWEAQGRGYAKEAARGLVARLQAAGWTVIAHIHPRPPGIPGGRPRRRAVTDRGRPRRRGALGQLTGGRAVTRLSAAGAGSLRRAASAPGRATPR
jgi:RimJ/RimL family protein N-acetyltransferase